MFTAAKKFSIPTLDLRVFDDTNTEVDEEVFDFLMKKQNLGVLEICLAQGPNPDGKFLGVSLIFLFKKIFWGAFCLLMDRVV